MKYWIYILDEPDTFSVVDMIEHSGTAYLPQLDEMKRGDIVFIATLEYGARCFIASLFQDWMHG